jgi:hypothetical protein
MRPGHRPSQSAICRLLVAALTACALWLACVPPSLAQTSQPPAAQIPEPLETQEKVDKYLGALGAPLPAPVHLAAPDTGRPDIAGQPYNQQPAGAHDSLVGGAGSGGGVIIISDARLKTAVRYLATLDNGLKIYAFRYLWDDAVHVGVMAQDLLALEAFRPAVVSMPSGYYAVDYARLGLRMATLADWKARGVAAVRR